MIYSYLQHYNTLFSLIIHFVVLFVILPSGPYNTKKLFVRLVFNQISMSTQVLKCPP